MIMHIDALVISPNNTPWYFGVSLCASFCKIPHFGEVFQGSAYTQDRLICDYTQYPYYGDFWNDLYESQ